MAKKKLGQGKKRRESESSGRILVKRKDYCKQAPTISNKAKRRCNIPEADVFFENALAGVAFSGNQRDIVPNLRAGARGISAGVFFPEEGGVSCSGTPSHPTPHLLSQVSAKTQKAASIIVHGLVSPANAYASKNPPQRESPRARSFQLATALGVDPPFFSTIAPFKNRIHSPWFFCMVSLKRIPGFRMDMEDGGHPQQLPTRPLGARHFPL